MRRKNDSLTTLLPNVFSGLPSKHDMPRPWGTYGVPMGAISDGTKFEGPDPYYWCHYGYAVANVDPRGCGHSEGEMPIWGVYVLG